MQKQHCCRAACTRHQKAPDESPLETAANHKTHYKKIMGKDHEIADHKLAELVGSVILFAGNVVV